MIAREPVYFKWKPSLTLLNHVPFYIINIFVLFNGNLLFVTYKICIYNTNMIYI